MNDHRLFRVMFIGLLFSVMYFSFDRASNAQASIAPTSSLLHRSSSALPAEQNNQSTLALECHLFHHQLFGARSSCFTSRLNSIEVLASATCKHIIKDCPCRPPVPPKGFGLGLVRVMSGIGLVWADVHG